MPDFDSDDLQENDDLGGTDDSDLDDKDQTSPPDDKTAKRISDLQSKYDKALAERNKALKALAALQGDESDEGNDKGSTERPSDAENSAVALAAALLKEAVFQQTPALAEAGFTADDLTGLTPQEIRASAQSLAKRYSSLETRIRNKVLSEHGLTPEIGDSKPDPKRDFSKMDSKDFNEFVASVMSRR